MNKILAFLALFIYFSANAEDAELVQEIRQHLKAIRNISADFMQQDDYGNKQYGKFYMSRPGKMRWEYKNPQELTIIVNGKKVYYYDKELDQASQYVGEKGPVNLMVEDDIFNAASVSFLDIAIHGKILETNFKNNENSDVFSLIFATNPIKLLGCSVKRESGERLWIKFKNLNTERIPEQSLFRFQHSWAPKY